METLHEQGVCVAHEKRATLYSQVVCSLAPPIIQNNDCS